MIGITSKSSSAIATALAIGQLRLQEVLIPQHAADHQRIRAAEQARNDELAHRGNEDEHRACDDAGHRQRQRDAQERLEWLAAEIDRRFEQRQIVLLEIRIQRQDHERQVRVHDADVHREVRLQHHDRLVDDAERHQHLVDQAVVAEQSDPRVHAQQERRPERQDDQQQQHVAPRSGRRARSRTPSDNRAADKRSSRSPRPSASSGTPCRYSESCSRNR